MTRSKIVKKRVKNTKLRCEKFCKFLSLLKNIKGENFHTFCKHISDDACEMIFECVHNVLYNDKIPESDRNRLKEKLLPMKNEVRYIAKYRNSFKKKKRYMYVLDESISDIADSLLPILENRLACRKNESL